MADFEKDYRDLERDLSFVPVDNPNPKRLTPEQMAHFNEHGYIRPLRIFDDAAVVRNRDYFDTLLAAVGGRNSYSINGYHTRCRGIYDLCFNPLILDYIEDLVGPDFVFWSTHFFCKMPSDPKKVPWHQDASYWPMTPAGTVTVWLAIDDADVENAAMKFIPGTHRMGHLKWRDTDGLAVLNQEIVDTDKLAEPVYNCLRAGEISLHADMLAHGSDPNTSDRRRCGLTIRYCPVTVHAGEGWNASASICRGTDSTGHWPNNPRPPGEDPAGGPGQVAAD